MTRSWRFLLVALMALAMVLFFTPAPAAAARVFVGGGWGWGPGWYGAYWGPGYYGPYGYPYGGTVKLTAFDKADSVFIDDAYAGVAHDMKSFHLRPGNHTLAVTAPGGQTLFNQRIEVLPGKTLKIHAGA